MFVVSHMNRVIIVIVTWTQKMFIVGYMNTVSDYRDSQVNTESIYCMLHEHSE